MRWIQRTLGIAYAAIVCGSTALQAQHRSPSLGTDAVQAVAISTSDIEAAGGGITWAQNATFYRYLTRGVLNLIAALSAPQASLLTALDLEARNVTERPLRRHPKRITPVIPSAYAVIPSGARDPVTGRPRAVRSISGSIPPAFGRRGLPLGCAQRCLRPGVRARWTARLLRGLASGGRLGASRLGMTA